jgi:lipopolysaccharide export system permease protein
MSLLFRYTLKEHLYPFFISLFVLIFVLLTNFLLKAIDKFLGKGLSFGIIIEYVFLNLAWILALAVPMAVLVATLMAFGRMSGDNEITALRSSGISYFKILFPSLFFGALVTIGMTWFNNAILPETNHKARLLSGDITRKRPDLEFEVGYFIDALPEYRILLGGRDKNIFKDILIFNYQKEGNQRTIIANSGEIEAVMNGVIMHLYEGVIHELSSDLEDYREIYFENYNIVIPVDNLNLTRRDSKVRSDREMTGEMIENKINGYNLKIENIFDRINNRIKKEIPDSIAIINQGFIEAEIIKYSADLRDSLGEDNIKYIRTKRRLKNLRHGIKSDFKLIETYNRYISKYEVEFYKKFSIPFASIVFVLIGASLGIITRKGGFAMSVALSLGFFVFYWAFLIAGEEFADRGQLSPFIAMWMPNIVLGILGIFLCIQTAKEQKIINFEFLNLFNFKSDKNND